MIAGAAVLLLLFSSLPHTRKRYGEFIRRVTESEVVPISKTETPEPADMPKTAEKNEKEEKNKFKFRF
jgi:hypothetical protein